MDKKEKKGKLSVSPTVKQRVKEVLHRARLQSAEEKKARDKKTEVKVEKMPPVVADCRGSRLKRWCSSASSSAASATRKAWSMVFL